MGPVINTERLTIREFTEADLPTFAKYRAMPSIAEFQSWTEYTYEDAMSLFNNMTGIPFGTEGRWFQLAIEDKSSNQLVGDLAVHFIDKDQIEVGFTVAPEFQKKGIAYEALYALCGFLFNTFKKHRIVATTDTNNIGSCQLLKKVGFRKEGHFIENIYFKGSWGSEFQFALLSSEWPTISNEPKTLSC